MTVNGALVEAMTERRVTPRQLAETCGVNEKTITRWMADSSRVPHPRHRWSACDLLGAEEATLWPLVKASVKVGDDREIVTAYPTLSAVPDRVWRDIVTQARRQIDLVGYAPYWFVWKVPGFADVLRRNASAGCKIRVILGDPNMELVAADEQATGAALTLTQRIAQTRHVLEPLGDVLEVRQTGMGFGRSVYRGDDTATVDWWLHGQPGQDFPVLHLRRHAPGGLFDQIAGKHVDALWADAVPVSGAVRR